MQQVQKYSGSTTVWAKNIGVNSGSSETIMLDQISSLGGRNIAVTIVNHSGSISAVALYGSPDGINWAAISSFSTFTVTAGATGHGEVAASWAFLRVTTTGIALVDVYLSAVQ